MIYPVLSVGITLEEDMAQICCMNPSTGEPESLCTADDHMNYQIPLELLKDRMSGEWLMGREAHEKALLDNRTLLKGFLKDYERDSSVNANGISYARRDLLKIFILKLFTLVKSYYPQGRLGHVTFALKDAGEKLKSDITGICEEFGLEDANIHIIPFNEAYAAYALSQSDDLWVRGTGLFEYGREGLHYYSVEIKRTSPRVAEVRDTDLSSFIGPDDYKVKSFEEMDKAFTSVIENLNIVGNVSCVYLYGQGFSVPWQDASIKLLCSRNRLFAGQNLYSKGACWYSALNTREFQDKRFALLSNSVCCRDISIYVYTEKGYAYYPVCSTGDPLPGSDDSIDIMLYKTENVWFRIYDVVEKKETFTSLRLEGVPVLNNYSSVVRFGFRMDAPCVLSVEAEDTGFGMFIKNSGKKWIKKLYADAGETRDRITPSGRVMYIRRDQGGAPYAFRDGGAKVNTYEELCYYVYSNIYALDRNMFSGDLFSWLSRYAGRKNLSKLLMRKASEGSSFRELVSILESKCVLFERKDIEDLLRVIDAMERQDPLQTKKAKGGNLLKYGHYSGAVSMYLGVLSEIRENGLPEGIPADFEASVYHDMGVAFTRMLDYKAAAEAFLKAYEEGSDNSELKNHILCLKALNNVRAIKDVMVKYELSDDTIRSILDEYTDAAELPARTIMSISQDQSAYIDKLKDTWRNT